MPSRWTNEWISRRLTSYDYSSPGEYFVTICTRHRECIFGSISAGQVTLSTLGNIAQEAWESIPARHANIQLDAFVIMPDHIHGILVFTGPGKSLSTIIGSYKSEVSRRANQQVWHRYFHDRVVRNREELNQIRRYIETNPQFDKS